MTDMITTPAQNAIKGHDLTEPRTILLSDAECHPDKHNRSISSRAVAYSVFCPATERYSLVTLDGRWIIPGREGYKSRGPVKAYARKNLATVRPDGMRVLEPVRHNGPFAPTSMGRRSGICRRQIDQDQGLDYKCSCGAYVPFSAVERAGWVIVLDGRKGSHTMAYAVDASHRVEYGAEPCSYDAPVVTGAPEVPAEDSAPVAPAPVSDVERARRAAEERPEAMRAYRVEFTWTNSRGTDKPVMTIVDAKSKTDAVRAARVSIASDYGITRAKLDRVSEFQGAPVEAPAPVDAPAEIPAPVAPALVYVPQTAETAPEGTPDNARRLIVDGEDVRVYATGNGDRLRIESTDGQLAYTLRTVPDDAAPEVVDAFMKRAAEFSAAVVKRAKGPAKFKAQKHGKRWPAVPRFKAPDAKAHLRFNDGDVCAETEAAPGVWVPSALITAAETAAGTGWTVAIERDPRRSRYVLRCAGVMTYQSGGSFAAEFVAVWESGVYMPGESYAMRDGRRGESRWVPLKSVLVTCSDRRPSAPGVIVSPGIEAAEFDACADARDRAADMVALADWRDRAADMADMVTEVPGAPVAAEVPAEDAAPVAPAPVDAPAEVPAPVGAYCHRCQRDGLVFGGECRECGRVDIVAAMSAVKPRHVPAWSEGCCPACFAVDPAEVWEMPSGLPTVPASLFCTECAEGRGRWGDRGRKGPGWRDRSRRVIAWVDEPGEYARATRYADENGDGAPVAPAGPAPVDAPEVPAPVAPAPVSDVDRARRAAEEWPEALKAESLGDRYEGEFRRSDMLSDLSVCGERFPFRFHLQSGGGHTVSLPTGDVRGTWGEVTGAAIAYVIAERPGAVLRWTAEFERTHGVLTERAAERAEISAQTAVSVGMARAAGDVVRAFAARIDWDALTDEQYDRARDAVNEAARCAESAESAHRDGDADTARWCAGRVFKVVRWFRLDLPSAQECAERAPEARPVGWPVQPGPSAFLLRITRPGWEGPEVAAGPAPVAPAGPGAGDAVSDPGGVDGWESDGGACPGVEVPRPVAGRDAELPPPATGDDRSERARATRYADDDDSGQGAPVAPAGPVPVAPGAGDMVSDPGGVDGWEFDGGACPGVDVPGPAPVPGTVAEDSARTVLSLPTPRSALEIEGCSAPVRLAIEGSGARPALMPAPAAGPRTPVAVPYTGPRRVIALAPVRSELPAAPGCARPALPVSPGVTGRAYWEPGERVTHHGRAGRTSFSRIGGMVRVTWDNAPQWQGSDVPAGELWAEGHEPQPARVIAPPYRPAPRVFALPLPLSLIHI